MCPQNPKRKVNAVKSWKASCPVSAPHCVMSPANSQRTSPKTSCSSSEAGRGDEVPQSKYVNEEAEEVVLRPELRLKRVGQTVKVARATVAASGSYFHSKILVEKLALRRAVRFAAVLLF